jgi:hypothetical protein
LGEKLDNRSFNLLSSWYCGRELVDMQALKLSNKFSIYGRSILIVAILSLLFLIQSCGAHHKNGAATPDRVVEGYLTALEAKNENAILRLMAENPIDIEIIDRKISKFGGYDIQERQVKYTKPKPVFWNAKIHGSYIDKAGIKRKFDESIAIEYQSKGELKLYAGRWYLILDGKV